MKFYPEKLAQLREYKKIPMSELAAESGVCRSSLWAWERGRRIPSPANIRAMANTLEVDVSEISDLKSVKNITYKSYSKSLKDIAELSSITKQVTPEKLKTMKSILESMEEELFNSSIVINALISSLDSAFYVKDINHKYILANKTFLKMLNLDENMNVFGRKDINFFPSVEASENTARDEEVINSGRVFEDMEGFLPGTRKSRWGLISKIPIFDKNKDIIGVTSIFKDTTDKRKADLRRLFLERALENVAEGVWIGEVLSNGEIKIVYVNTFFEKTLGIEAGLLYKGGIRLENLMRPEDLARRVRSRLTRKFPAYYRYNIMSVSKEEIMVEEVVSKFDERHLIGIITPESSKSKNLINHD